MKYRQYAPLLERLIEQATLYHASRELLRAKMWETLDEHLPELDEGCKERGCACLDNFPNHPLEGKA
jgi:hypothetical protein